MEKALQGVEEDLTVDILKDSKAKLKNVAMVWIGYKNVFDMIRNPR